MLLSGAQRAGRSLLLRNLRATTSCPAPRWLSTKFLKTHEYLVIDGNVGRVGITDHAQSSLGAIVYLELPEVGDSFEGGEQFGEIESLKAASDLFLPCSGVITEVNEALGAGTEEDELAIINEDAEGGGWICKVEITGPLPDDILLDKDGYEAFVAEEDS